MDEEQLTKSVQIISDLLLQYQSMRNFGRAIQEDASDILRWKHGRKVKARAVVTINRIHGISPYDLRPDLFPRELKFVYEEMK